MPGESQMGHVDFVVKILPQQSHVSIIFFLSCYREYQEHPQR